MTDTQLAAMLHVASLADRDETGELTERGRAQLRAVSEPEEEEFDEADWRREEGPRGGTVWVNRQGRRVYGAENPGRSHRSGPASPPTIGGIVRSVKEKLGGKPAAQQVAKTTTTPVGRMLEPGEVNALGGGEPGAKVYGNEKVAKIEHETADYTTRLTLARGPDGPEAHYDAIVVKDHARNTPVAARVLATQVAALKALGVKKITADAARDDTQDFIGYRVWPKMGFDGPLLSEHKAALPSQFQAAKTLSELYAMPGGKQAWEKGGKTIAVSLDLDKSERMLSLLAKMAQRGGVAKMAEADLTLDDLSRLGVVSSAKDFDEAPPVGDMLAALLRVAEQAERDEDGELTERGRAQLRAAAEREPDGEAEAFGEGDYLPAWCPVTHAWVVMERFAEEDWVHSPTAKTKRKWVNKNTGRVVYSDANPGVKKGRGKKEDAPADNKPKKSGDPVGEAKAHVEDLRKNGLTGDGAKKFADMLFTMTVAQLGDLKKQLGLKASGAKAELVAKLKERALAGLKAKQKGQPEEKPEAEEQPQPDKIEPKAEEPQPEPEPEQPEPEQTKPAEVVPQPHPPEPGFTGYDTLGRKWVDGKLVPGEEEPLKVRQRKHTEPKAPIRLKGLTDQPLSDEEHNYLTGHGDPLADAERGGRVIFRATDMRGKPEPMFDALVKRGLLKEAGGSGSGQATLTLRGAGALMGKSQPELAGKDRLEAPKTPEEADLWQSLYAVADESQRKAILGALGWKGDVAAMAKVPDDSFERYKQNRAFSKALEEDSKAGTSRSQEAIRKSKQAIAITDALSRLGVDPAADFDKRKRALANEYSTLTGQLDGYKGRRLKPAEAKQYAALKEEVKRKYAAYEELNKQRAEEMSKAREEVKNHLAKLVKEPLEIKHQASTKHPPSPGGLAAMDGAVTWLKGIVDAAGGNLPTLTTSQESDRANYKHGDRTIDIGRDKGEEGVGTGVHEIGHAIEMHVPGALQACRDFIEYRCGDEEFTDLRDKYGDAFHKDEKGRKDKFDLAFPEYHAYYIGKKYSDATEVLSMGIEKLYDDPSGFARKDPDYCAFIVGLLTNTLGKG